jgi:hypothetical protein
MAARNGEGADALAKGFDSSASLVHGRTLAGAARPDVGARGGTLGGFPVLTSAAVGAEDLILLDRTQIAVAMGNGSLRASEQANVELVDSSSMTSGYSVSAANTTSLFQTDSIGFIGSITAN